MNYQVYLLYHSDYNVSYIGITNDIDRRLKQHNKIIKGGAKYTTRFTPKWGLVDITNFMSKSKALKLEYKLKKYSGINNRINAFQSISNQ